MFPEDAFGDADLASMVMFIKCRDKNPNLLEHATKPCKNVLTQFNAFYREANLPNQYVSDNMIQEDILIYDAMADPNGLIYVRGKITLSRCI